MGLDHIKLHSAKQLIVLGLAVGGALGKSCGGLLDLHESAHSESLLEGLHVEHVFDGGSLTLD